jgi:hypothetical protein
LAQETGIDVYNSSEGTGVIHVTKTLVLTGHRWRERDARTVDDKLSHGVNLVKMIELEW